MFEMDMNLAVIGGVHKAATTSLFYYLSRCRDICQSSVKETHFFSYNYRDGNVLKNYERFYKCNGGEKYLLEASPEYIYGGDIVHERMNNVFDKYRIIFIIREQVDKIISNYRHRIKTVHPANEYPVRRAGSYFEINSLIW